MKEPTILSLQYLSNLYKVLPELLSKMSGEDTEHTPIKIDPENEQGEGSTVDPNLQSYPLVMMVRVNKIQGTPLPKCLFTEDIIHEVFHESVGSVDILNDYKICY